MSLPLRFLAAAALPALAVGAAFAADAPRAARSVHLHYRAPEATLFYNEVTVDQSQPGSYFCACGFAQGYFGIQQLTGQRKKVAIFSVWEPGQQNDPNSVPADRRVELLEKGEGVRAGRFGGEGTGGQSFLDYDWKPGETYRFLVRAVPKDERTAYSAYFYLNGEKRWQHMATFSTLSKGSYLKGYYSFIEDFRRDGASARESRRAHFGNGWVRAVTGEWLPLTQAKFTGDQTPTLNVDAGTAKNGFFLATGGETTNSVPLGTNLTRAPIEVDLPQFPTP